MKPLVARGYLFIGGVFEIAGRREEALKNLRKAEKMHQDMRVAPQFYWLTRIREALSRLE